MNPFAADTPVMSNMRKIPMRRETIKALEVRRNTVMGEARRRSTMQTLGANNEFNRNKNRHRNSTTIVGAGNVERIYSPNGSTIGGQSAGMNNNSGGVNEGYEISSDEDRSTTTRNSIRAQPAGTALSLAAAGLATAADGRSNSQML